MKFERVYRRIDGLLIQARAQIERAERFRRDELIAAAIQERDALEQQDDPVLLQRFFALEESIPSSPCDVLRGIDGKTYDRTWYRSDRAHIEQAVASGRIRHGDRATMRDWCDLYELGGIEA